MSTLTKQLTLSAITQPSFSPGPFYQASSRAGRKLSRTAARRELSLEGEIARLEKAGVIHAIRYKEDLDEAAGAYKNIDKVMAAQADLVRIKTRLSPIAVIKG